MSNENELKEINTPESQNSGSDDKNDMSSMTIVDHLDELRSRLIKCLYVIGIGFLGCYFFKEKIFKFLLKPAAQVLPDNGSFAILSPAEGFFTYLKVALFAGALLASPVILYQIWRFISPGLHKQEKKYVIPFVFFSTLFFFAGASFCYYVVFPYGYKFFMSFATGDIRATVSIREYLKFSIKLLFAFGIVFELPLFSFFLSKAGIIDKEFLAQKRRYFIVLAFVMAAMLTPPDIETQFFMAGPLIILYELSVWIARIFAKPPIN